MQELLPVKYYHVVFTLPHELNSLILGHRQLLFKLLFDASSQTLLTFAKDPQYLDAVPGIISVLHSWGQQLSFHPHIHCIVSGGGITAMRTPGKRLNVPPLIGGGQLWGLFSLPGKGHEHRLPGQVPARIAAVDQ